MPEDSTFSQFIDRIRAGDEKAAEELVKRFEPVIRMEVRMGMRDPSLNRLFDSMDICQSVLGSFFVRAASGQFDLNKPENLVHLLVRMARNKLASQARLYYQDRRDVRRMSKRMGGKLDTVADDPSPSQVVAGRELLERFRECLTEEERRLVLRRNQGQSWAEIATEMGGSPNARCQQLTRAVDRVAQQLGLDE
jgi:RNA polymerase sigma-70 factor (ECF subfamily)